MNGRIELTWLGTNSFLLKVGGSSVLVDPFVKMPGAENPNSLEELVEVAQLNNVRDILVTHCHFDHLASAPQLMKAHPALVCCTECGLPALKADGCNCETVIPIAPDNTFDIGCIKVSVYPGKHIKFDAKLVAQTLSPANMMRAPQNLEQILKWLGKYKESGETVVYDLKIEPSNDGNTRALRIQFLGSCSLLKDAAYKTGADYLILPYQGNTHIDSIAAEVIERLGPKCIIASHFDDAFPPISQTVETAGLKDLMERQFPDVPLLIPTVNEAICL